MSKKRIGFLTSHEVPAMEASRKLQKKYGSYPLGEADVIVALGGDGFMLRSLHDTTELSLPVYGMNFGTIGFLMNDFSENSLLERLNLAEETLINPLTMTEFFFWIILTPIFLNIFISLLTIFGSILSIINLFFTNKAPAII